MKIIVEFNEARFPPLLELVIYDAPHRRVHRRVIEKYREDLHEAFQRKGIAVPIDGPVDVYINFVNPTSTDNGNIYLALERAMDGKALSGLGIVTDDANIEETRIRKFWPDKIAAARKKSP